MHRRPVIVPPLPAAAWRAPALAVLAAAAVVGQWIGSPQLIELANAIDATGWKIISGVANAACEALGVA